jgi:hypothetical protein
MAKTDTAVKDGDTIVWTSASLPSGMYVDHGIVFYPDEEYIVGEDVGADFANALIADGHCAKLTKKAAPVSAPVDNAKTKEADKAASD